MLRTSKESFKLTIHVPCTLHCHSLNNVGIYHPETGGRGVNPQERDETCLIHDDSLSRSEWRSIAPGQKSSGNQRQLGGTKGLSDIVFVPAQESSEV